MSSALLVGVGNAWRGDDAVGLEVVRLVEGTLLPGAEAREWEGEPMGLIDIWDGRDSVVVVDAVSSGAPAGTIHRLEASEQPLDADLFRTSTHTVSLAETIEVARTLGRLPARVVVYGIEGERFEAGEGLSDAVAVAVARAFEAVREEMEQCTRRP